MAHLLDDLRREFRPMLALAAPLALAELGWMAMGVVDTVMAGPLGSAAIGAGSLGSMLFYPIAIFGTGMLLGMDALVAQSFGAGDRPDCRRTLVNGLWLGAGLAPALALAIWALIPLLAHTGTNPRVLVLFAAYLKALLWGILPLLFYTAFRRYLQAVDIVKPIAFALVSANVVNIAGNYALMYGHWGFPAMGLTGSGYSTSIARFYMAAVLLAAVAWHERTRPLSNGAPSGPGSDSRSEPRTSESGWCGYSFRPDIPRLRRLAALGLPAALQILAEGAVFGVVTVFAARLDEASLAAHGIAVIVVSTTYMVPLGIASAAAVRVGQAVGRKDQRGVAASGWSALAIGALFMGTAGVALWTVPRWIVEVITHDAAVVAVGVGLLRIAAFFELFDGLQAVATGALRGLGDTRSPLLAHLAGYWMVGLPVAYLLCFHFRWGAPGIWVGLSAALILIGSALLVVWKRRLSRGVGPFGPR
jgi:MATE family multidrug resistance protein